MSDATYRYTLRRETGLLTARGDLIFVMLNPSTADETQDDPTIRRLRGFAARENRAEFRVLNLYAARATDPKRLREFADPVGPENMDMFRREFQYARHAVAAWGSFKSGLQHNLAPTAVFAKIDSTLRGEGIVIKWLCLGTTKDGAPRHPLYVKADAPLVKWNAGRWLLNGP